MPQILPAEDDDAIAVPLESALRREQSTTSSAPPRASAPSTWRWVAASISWSTTAAVAALA